MGSRNFGIIDAQYVTNPLKLQIIFNNYNYNPYNYVYPDCWRFFLRSFKYFNTIYFLIF